jgi:hypothetical protein
MPNDGIGEEKKRRHRRWQRFAIFPARALDVSQQPASRPIRSGWSVAPAAARPEQ